MAQLYLVIFAISFQTPSMLSRKYVHRKEVATQTANFLIKKGYPQMKRLLMLLLATVFAVNIFFGSWSEFRDWVQAFAKDLREFVVDAATDKDWWKLKSTPTPAKTETREIDLGGSGVVVGLNATSLLSSLLLQKATG
jgi:hypothetical protein